MFDLNAAFICMFCVNIFARFLQTDLTQISILIGSA